MAENSERLNDADSPRKRWKLRFGIKSLLALMLLTSLLLVNEFLWYKFDRPYDNCAHVELTHKVDFLGDETEVWVILEQGRSTPTFRQRRLIQRLQGYDASLEMLMDDAANDHRIMFDDAAGHHHHEYGLPLMTREIIGQHYGIGLIWIPKLSGSSDDFVVLGCDCDWEIEHGMQMLVKNGTSVPWQGGEGPGEWKAAYKFVEEEFE